ncbi:MAG: 4Fe-4S dicluster domain-containing protein [Firmicutes bacterium]|nr:4Fe-4S dicluster domain-containing protein [Bacillota bacterium]
MGVGEDEGAKAIFKAIFVRLDRCLGCRQCEISCALEHSKTKDLYKAVWERPGPRQRVRVVRESMEYYPLRCFHCEDPPCVSACISGAMQVEVGTGRVVNDLKRCVGCWMCVMVCPYGVIQRHEDSRVALKCDRCPDQEEPACVRDCPTGALIAKPAVPKHALEPLMGSGMEAGEVR